MANGIVFTKNGKIVSLNRTFKVTPDYLAPTVFKVGTGTTTPTVADTDLETPVDITLGVQIKDFVTSYPVLDETNVQATTRCLLLTNEANSNTLTEFGVFNEDASPLMLSRLVHTGIAKTSSIQLVYVEKDRYTL
jgi:hypothetical protein